MEDTPKRITLGLIVSWVLGVLFAIAGLVLLFSNPLSGLLVLLASAVILPPANQFMAQKMKWSLSGGVKLILVIVLLALAGVASGKEKVPDSALATPSPTVSNGASATKTAAPAPAAKSYQRVFTFTGSGAKKSEPFTIQGDRFKIKYDCRGDLCQAFLYKVGSSIPASLIMNQVGSVQDETIVYGSGEYYIESNTLGSYTMVVEDYR